MRAKDVMWLGLMIAGGCAHPPAPPAEGVARVQIIAFNDFHGNLRPPGGDVEGVVAGGVAYFAAHVDRLRATNEHSVVVSAGDLVGASPLLSALFHDEPTIEAMNAIGIDYNGVGNHEFDEGADELLRLARGGCHPVEGCQDETPYDGAKFGFLAANVRREGVDGTLFPPYAVRELDGVKVAFIGMTLEDTARFVPPVIEDVSFADEADTANAIVETLQKEGVEAFVVIVHEGGFAEGGYDGCEKASGPIVDVVERMSPAIDVVVTGHTHQAYNCEIANKRVTSAGCFGRLLTDIDLEIDRSTGDVVKVSAKNVIVTQDVPPAQTLETLVQRYERLSAPLADRVVGRITAPLTKAENEAGESTLGNVIADAQLAATAAPERGGAQLAIMNAGGIRTDLAAGDVTYGQVFSVQPFGNTLVTITLTGEQIHELLESQWKGDRARMLNVSSTLRYTWRSKAQVGSKVDFDSIRLAGAPIRRDAEYRVTVNDYLAGRGVLARGTDRRQGVVDLEALIAYLGAKNPLQPPRLERIRRE